MATGTTSARSAVQTPDQGNPSQHPDAQPRLLAALVGTGTNALFFAEDFGQRMIQQPVSWTYFGVDILSTMHLAKDLEFRVGIVMACDEDVIPNAERIKAIIDDSDLDEVVASERYFLSVACTRARDHLLITSGTICSKFVQIMLP